MQEAELKKNDDSIGIKSQVSNNGDYCRLLNLGKVGDNFNVGDVVYVLTEAEYHSLLMQSSTTDDQTTSEDIENKFEKLLKISLEPINKNHDKQLQDKANEIKQLKDEIKELKDKINIMQSAFNQFNTKINSLSAIDILFRKKHNEIISDFSNSVWIKNDNQTINADVQQVTSKDD